MSSWWNDSNVPQLDDNLLYKFNAQLLEWAKIWSLYNWVWYFHDNILASVKKLLFCQFNETSNIVVLASVDCIVKYVV